MTKKRAEEALRESEARCRGLFDSSVDGILIADLETKMFRRANRAICGMLGYSEEELRMLGVADIHPREALPLVMAEFEAQVRGDKTLASDLPCLRKDGAVFYADISAGKTMIDGRACAMGIFRDVTERKKAADRLEKMNACLLSLGPDSSANINRLTALCGELLGATCSLYNRLEGGTLSSPGRWRTPHDFSPKDSPDGHICFDVIRKGADGVTVVRDLPATSYAATDPNVAKYGLRTYVGHVVRCAGEPVGSLCAVFQRDFEPSEDDRRVLGIIASTVGVEEERAKAEASTREAYGMEVILNEILRNSLANIPLKDMLARHLSCLLSVPWLAIAPKGAVFVIEGGALTLTANLGLSPALASACAKVPLGRCLCGRAAQSGKVVTRSDVDTDHEVRVEGMSPHGHYCAPIVAGGKTLGVLNLYLKAGAVFTEKQAGFIKAVTDVLAANIVHSQVELQLSQSQKMESVGRLAGGVAHDFNNLLTAINGYAGFVLEGLAEGDSKREDVKEILAAGARAAALTRQLLAFSRKQILNPQVLDLNAVVGGTVKMLKRLIGEDIQLKTKLAARSCMVKVDAGQIDQVLINLAVNARDAMPRGGALTVETGIALADANFSSKHPDMSSGPWVCLSVRDTGCGMTDEVKARLFEPFYTTKEKGKGTGLGLATIFGIIKQSGGEIEVESVLGCATTFRIYFPQVNIPSQDQDPDDGGPLRGHETVLLVEDEEIVRRLGERALSANGYAVLIAASGPEALKAIERHGKPVDLLVTDVVMPGMDGRELAQALAKKNMARRTLFVSGYTDDAIVRHGVLEPGLAFLYKPFTPDALLRKMREVLDGPADQAKA